MAISVQIASGSALGPFVVDRKVGQRGTSAVFLGRDPRGGGEVNLKVLADDAGVAIRARLLREARTLADLDHPGLVRTLGAGDHEGAQWVATEVVRGQDLRRVLAERGAIAIPRALHWVKQAADALSTAHDHGVLHRQLRPASLVVTRDTREDRIRVGDFGNLRRRVDPATRDSIPPLGEGENEPVYLAPEQIEHGLSDERSDVWALGSIAYELCTGFPAFARGSRAASFVAVLRDEPHYPPSLGPAVTDLLTACLRKNSFARLGSMREVMAMIRDALENSLLSEAPSDWRASQRSSRGWPSVKPSSVPPSSSFASSMPPPPGSSRSGPPSSARPLRASSLPPPPPTQPAPYPPLPTPSTQSAPSASMRAAAPPPSRPAPSVGSLRIATPTVATPAPPPPSLAAPSLTAVAHPSSGDGKVKGTAVRTGLVWYANTRGMGALRRIYASASEDLKAIIRLDDPGLGIVASTWYDTRALGELLQLFGEYDDPLNPSAYTERLAEAIAADNVTGVYRSLFRLITTPMLLEANIQRVWRTYFDEGTCRASSPRPGGLAFEVRDWSGHQPEVCRVTGYVLQHVLRALGYQGLTIERVACTQLGDPHCAFNGAYQARPFA